MSALVRPTLSGRIALLRRLAKPKLTYPSTVRVNIAEGCNLTPQLDPELAAQLINDLEELRKLRIGNKKGKRK